MKPQPEFVTIEVDGRSVSVRKDMYLLWTLRELGSDVPHFCAHKWLDPPFAGCRQCMVQIELGGKMMPKLQTSCSTLPMEGMRVFTLSEPVLQARKEQLEFHLLNHPLECPTCDKGGECMLQDQVMDHGVATGRYIEPKRIRPDAVMNEYILMNYKRCIHCKRCIHFCADIDGSHLLKFVERGAATWIESFPEPGGAPRFTGNVIDICPVGALTARSYRFMGRPWEQEPSASVGSLDSVGANIWLAARLGEMARIIPRDNDAVENGLIDDVTRFHWEAINARAQFTSAMLRTSGGEEQLSIGRGYAEAARRIGEVLGEHGPGSVGIIAGAGLNTEEYLALRRFGAEILQTQASYFGDELFAGVKPDAAVLHSFATEGTTVDGIVNAETIVSIGCDLFEEAPALGLRVDMRARRGESKLISLRSHRSDADRFATHFSDYAYGNLLRTVGQLTAMVGGGTGPDELMPIAAALQAVGADCAILYGHEVWRSADALKLVHALSGLRAAVASANSGPVYLNPVYPSVNTAGALLVNHLEDFGVTTAQPVTSGSLRLALETAASGKLKLLLVVDSDTLSTYPDRGLVERALDGVETVIAASTMPDSITGRAWLWLPLGTYAHRDGTVVSMEWRVQRRERAVLSDVAPGVLELLNGIAAESGLAPISPNDFDLNGELRGLIPEYAQDDLKVFPTTGVLIRPRTSASAPPSGGELPAEFKGNAEWPFVVVPKRFLYNDRAELRFTPAFDKVDKPFYAFINPLDMKVHNLSSGDLVQLQLEGSSAQLPIRSANWVRPGSVVVNDHCLAAPANAICGWQPARVSLSRIQQAAGVEGR